jgi:hypothetical protein
MSLKATVNDCCLCMSMAGSAMVATCVAAVYRINNRWLSLFYFNSDILSILIQYLNLEMFQLDKEI